MSCPPAFFSLEYYQLGVFVRLVLAPVFKTGGGFEQSSLWVRFPYIPVLAFGRLISLFAIFSMCPSLVP